MVLCLCEVCVWILCVDGRSRYLCIVLGRYLCTSEVHPVFNPVAPYGYLFSDMYLFMADITNPLVCLRLSDLDWSPHHPLL